MKHSGIILLKRERLPKSRCTLRAHYIGTDWVSCFYSVSGHEDFENFSREFQPRGCFPFESAGVTFPIEFMCSQEVIDEIKKNKEV